MKSLEKKHTGLLIKAQNKISKFIIGNGKSLGNSRNVIVSKWRQIPETNNKVSYSLTIAMVGWRNFTTWQISTK